MTYFIDDPRKWRISKSGFSIKTGWADEKKIIAKYPGAVAPLDGNQFQEWMGNAERICDLHNATLTPNGEVRGASVTAQPACEASSGEAATSTVLLGATARND